ncbi:MAG: putative rane protein, partial [Nevskia sp.]|nr:putative rane protein [Nevskia sp.]
MNLSAPRDEYCERLGPGLLAEPANALSNLAFFVAAYLLWRLLARAYAGRPIPGALRALPILIALIGCGSSAYHTFAVVWAEILDVLFIGVFIYFYVVCFLRYFVGLNWWLALLGVPGFWLFGWLVSKPFAADAFNGSTGYFPALFGIILMCTY